MFNLICPLIAGGLSTFDRADSYLSETLHSVLGQTNAPTDNTWAWVQSFSDPRINLRSLTLRVGR
jgi:hypothetical protein